MEEVDRISELPEPILHNILSFLPFKEAGQTSVLSKTWGKTWNRYPVLEFNRGLLPYPPISWFTDEDKIKEAKKKRKMLFRTLEKAVRDRYCREMITIEKLSIASSFFSNEFDFTSFLQRCLFYADRSGVKELAVEFSSCYGPEFKLPPFLLCSDSIESLKLQTCKFVVLPEGGIQLSSLRKLFLSNVFADDQLIASLISGCSDMEDLNLDSCRGFNRLELSGLTKLQTLRLVRNSNLEHLFIKNLNIHLLEICWMNEENEDSEEVEVKVTACDNIRSLILRNFSGLNNWFYRFTSQFPLLERLELHECCLIETLKISRRLLQELIITESWLDDLQIDAPNLSVFRYNGSIVPIQLNTSVLSKLNIEIDNPADNLEWIEKYVDFLRKFHPSPQFLHLESTPGQNESVAKEFRARFPSPLVNVSHLNTTLLGGRKISKLVDNLLWISPHAKNVSINHCRLLNIVSKFEFSYAKPLSYQGEFVSCCKSQPISCWKYCISKVKLEITGGTQCKEICHLSGANIMEQIDMIIGAVER